MIKRFCDYCGGDAMNVISFKSNSESDGWSGFVPVYVGTNTNKPDICKPCLIRGLQGEVLEVRG